MVTIDDAILQEGDEQLAERGHRGEQTAVHAALDAAGRGGGVRGRGPGDGQHASRPLPVHLPAHVRARVRVPVRPAAPSAQGGRPAELPARERAENLARPVGLPAPERPVLHGARPAQEERLVPAEAGRVRQQRGPGPRPLSTGPAGD